MARSQSQILIDQFINPPINQQVHMDAPGVNYVISQFEGHINPGDLKGLKIYLQEKNEIDKESESYIFQF